MLGGGADETTRRLRLSGRAKKSERVRLRSSGGEEDLLRARADESGDLVPSLFDPAARPEWRLENRILQRRARWLLTQADQLFLEPGESK